MRLAHLGPRFAGLDKLLLVLGNDIVDVSVVIVLNSLCLKVCPLGSAVEDFVNLELLLLLFFLFFLVLMIRS